MFSQIKIYILAAIGLIIGGLVIALRLKSGKVEALQAKVETEQIKTKQVADIVKKVKAHDEFREEVAQVAKDNSSLSRDALRERLRKYKRD